MTGIIAADWYDIAVRAKVRAANEVPSATPPMPLEQPAAGTRDRCDGSFSVSGASFVGVSSLNSPGASQGAPGLSGGDA